MALGVAQGCPREVRLLLAGPYYYDVDMVNSLPNVARQLAGLGMVSEPNLQALRTLCSERDGVLGGIVTHYGLVGSPALGERGEGCGQGPAHPAAKRRQPCGMARGARADGGAPDVPADGAA